MTQIAHVITGLGVGGAQTMMLNLLPRLQPASIASQVVSLTEIDVTGERLRRMGIPVRTLGMRRGVPNPWAVIRLASWLRKSRPDVVQTWMYHADLVGGLAAKVAGGIPVVWNIRHSNLEADANKHATIWTARACGRLSRLLPARIVCCSQVARNVHATIGYDEKRMIVIPNGFDIESFKPDPSARALLRAELGLEETDSIIGLIARFDPQKGHRDFVTAAQILHQEMSRVRFVLCGDGVTWANAELVGWIVAAGLANSFHLLGRRDDVPRLTAALDVASSASIGEGFPNVIGEAMACGIPCVVTNVGDSAYLVGDTGFLVPSGAPTELARKWRHLLSMRREERENLGKAARARIEHHFRMEQITTRYENLYRELTDVRNHRFY